MIFSPHLFLFYYYYYYLFYFVCFFFHNYNKILFNFFQHHPIPVSFLQAFWGLVVCAAMALGLERHNLLHAWTHATPKAWAGIVYLGVANSSAAFLLQFYLIHRIGAVRQKMVSFLGPVFALIEGVAIFKDWSRADATKISTQVLGTLLVFAGIYIVNLKPKPKAQTRDPALAEPLVTGAINGSEPDVDGDVYDARGQVRSVRFNSYTEYYSTDLVDLNEATTFVPGREYLTSFDPKELQRQRESATENGAKSGGLYMTM